MREGSKKLRRLGFAAVFVLAVSATPRSWAKTNPACGVPAALGDGWTIDSPESVGLDGARLCAHRRPAEGNRGQRSRRGHRPPWQARVRAVFPRL